VHAAGGAAAVQRELERLRSAAVHARAAGLDVHAGHGLTYENVARVAALADIEELNIGHSVVSRALLVGMERAVRGMVEIIRETRRLRPHGD
jgi:pyridoxine 5-phosphate synthase